MKRYLGDGAYAELRDDNTIHLTAEDGIKATDRIVLEPEVLAELERFLRDIRMQSAAREES